MANENIIDKFLERNKHLALTILKDFCHKQGFSGCDVSDINVEGVIVFDGQFMIAFSDILLDTQFDIPKGIAIRYMQGFDLDLDDGRIDKELSYLEYLKIKKLI